MRRVNRREQPRPRLTVEHVAAQVIAAIHGSLSATATLGSGHGVYRRVAGDARPRFPGRWPQRPRYRSWPCAAPRCDSTGLHVRRSRRRSVPRPVAPRKADLSTPIRSMVSSRSRRYVNSASIPSVVIENGSQLADRCGGLRVRLSRSVCAGRSHRLRALVPQSSPVFFALPWGSTGFDRGRSELSRAGSL